VEQKLSRGGTLLHWSSVEPTVGSPKPTVLLIHYTFGNDKTLQRHIELFNSLGHSCVTFNLFRGSTIKEPSPFTILDSIKFLYLVWSEQIHEILNSLEGDKVVFSMSFPSLSGLMACHNRKDIKGYICDGGPFTDVMGSIYRLYKQQGKFSNPIWGAILVASGAFYLGPTANLHLQQALNSWPTEVPILSIRGGKDPVVPATHIDAIFKDHRQLNWSAFEIEEAGHLDGLKNFPDVYSQKIREFLASLK
jgi:pimeloyl-ACP methyl ester carboxylesterase